MKYLIFAFALPLHFAFADGKTSVQKLDKFLAEPEVAEICETEERIKPVIRKGEVKISYPCEAFETIPAEAEKESISFFEPLSNPGSLETKGLIIRTRVSDESDATVKFRPKSGEGILLDKTIYSQLEASQTAELKCESDVTYSPDGFKNVESCSLTTETDKLNENHELFLKMVGASKVSLDLADYKKFDIQSTSWKMKNPSFAKGISLERWDLKNGDKTHCIFEVSAKFEVKKEPAATVAERLDAEIKKTLENLKSSFPGLHPDSIQGNKTGRAMEFLKAPSKTPPTY